MNVRNSLKVEPLKSIVSITVLIIVVILGTNKAFQEVYHITLIIVLIIVIIYSYKHSVKSIFHRKMVLTLKDSNKNNISNWLWTLVAIMALIKVAIGIISGNINKGEIFNYAIYILIGIANLIPLISANFITNTGITVKGNVFLWNEVNGWNWDEKGTGILNICISKYGVLGVKDKNYRFVVDNENIMQVNSIFNEFVYDKCKESTNGV